MKTYPRYFVGRLWTELDAYLRFDSQHSCVWVKNDGKETPQPPGPEWDADKPDHTWNEVTVNEAESRLLQEARPLRWVENCKPDRVGHWAYKVRDSACSYVDLHTEDELQNVSNGFWWCYLGPIPEILPPKKKVVQRLWLSYAKQTATDAAEYLQCWLTLDYQLIGEGNWIRTDETREVEE